jgi:hypothetical protein
VHSEAFNKFTFVGDVLGKLANYDLMLFKDNDQRIIGFPWMTFVEHTDNAVVSAPLRSTQRDHMIFNTKKKKSQDVQFHDSNHWLFEWNGRKWHSRLFDKFESIKSVKVPFLETYFVLVDAMFAKHFFERALASGSLDDSSLDYLWCKAAFDWSSERPSCTLIPLVSTHEDSLNNMKRDAFIVNESRENSIQIQSSRKDLDTISDKMMLIAMEWKAIVGKQHTPLEMEQLCLKRMNIEFVDAVPDTSISDCARTFIEQYELLSSLALQEPEEIKPNAERERAATTPRLDLVHITNKGGSAGEHAVLQNLNDYPKNYSTAKQKTVRTKEATNNDPANLSNDVLKFDEHVLANVRETYRGARSFTAWAPNADPVGDIGQFQTIPLLATVDRRPIIVRKQLIGDKKNRLNLAANGKLLGCAMTGATFISDLELLELEHYAPTCDVCFQFSNHEDMANFVPSLGYEALKPGLQSTSTKCFEGEATVEARFAAWQRGDRRFKGYGYQWHVDCALPNGIQELTCREISRMQNEIDLLDDVQKIYFKTKFSLDGWFRQPDSNNDEASHKRRFSIGTEWPWTAVMSHDDDRSAIANGLSASWNDIDSKFVPSSHHEMSLAHVEGPGYDQSEDGGHVSLKSMNADKLSKGGIHPRLASNLFHLIRNAPGSTHMVAVVDGQAQRSYKEMLTLLNTNISDLFKMYGNRVFGNVGALNDKDLIPISSMNPMDDNSSQPSMTLLELLRIRNIKIHMVPIITPPLVFEKTVRGGQYTFAPYLAARYSADYQVIMFVDGDTAMVESSNKRTLNEILYDRFFGRKSSKCAGHRMRLIEQYVKPEYNNNEAVLQCTQNLALDKENWQYALKNCHLKEGHIVARTDSVYAFSVHHPDTLVDYLPEGVEDCIPQSTFEDQKAMLEDSNTYESVSRYYLGEDEFVQLHLRDRERKAECACFFEPAKPKKAPKKKAAPEKKAALR